MSVTGRSAAALILTLATAFGFRPPPARADGAEAKRHYDAGVKMYNLGRFDQAIAEFETAYEQDPVPIFLFNIAQAHRKGGRAERAIFFYRRYLDADPKTSRRAEIEQRIAQLEASEETSRPTERPPEPTKAAPPQPPGVPQPAERKIEPPTIPSGRTHALRTATYATSGLALASVVGGLAFGASAKSQGETNSGAMAYAPDADDRGKRAETLQWVCFGVAGAAAVATGVLLYLDHKDAQETSSRLAFSPVVLPTHVGAQARWSF